MLRDNEVVTKECTFHPSVKTPRASKQSIDKPLEERLMHEADKRKERREKLKRDRENEQMKDCSFKPKLVSNSSQATVNINKLTGQAPIHERVGNLQKEKNERL